MMYRAKYDAMDIAEYVLWFYKENLNKHITNLRLQKILYYIQGNYIAIQENPLFENEIEAWKYGPVIPDVYYYYNNFMGNEIEDIKNEMPNIDEETIQVINNVIIEKEDLSAWKLVEATHNESPWIDNYVYGENNEISVNDIREWFDGE